VEVLARDVGDGLGETEALPHLGADFAVLIGVGDCFPQIVKQSSARDQLQIEVLPGSSGDVDRLFRHQDAVADVLFAQAGLQEDGQVLFADDV
jgi:hypothetical protein